MATQTLSTRKRRVFDSVFGTPNISLPTPYATPATGFPGPGQTWGGPSPRAINEKLRSSVAEARGQSQPQPEIAPDQHVDDQVKWDRAWHLVTHFLTPPQFQGDGMERHPVTPQPNQVDEKFHLALKVVVNPGIYVPLARATEDVRVWYTLQVRQDFLRQILPIVIRLKKTHVNETLLGRSLKALEMGNDQYFHGLWIITEGLQKSTTEEKHIMTEKFKRDLSAVIVSSVMGGLTENLRNVLRKRVFEVLGIPRKNLQSASIRPEGEEAEKARDEIMGLVEALRDVGLAGESFQVLFAEVMNDAMSEFVHRGYRGVWSSSGANMVESGTSILPRIAQHGNPSCCVTEICEWIENRYSKLAVQVLGSLQSKVGVTWTDKEKYKEMSIGRLADLRIKELFDIVINWPNSSGALDDLRTAITTPQRRLHLTEVFAKTLQTRLLHPGTSTLEILQTYIAMIWSFHALDHSKVLLDRVAYPLQAYLCSREDTVRIIITGLLTDTHDAEGNAVRNGDKLVELAHLLNKSPEELGNRQVEEELDWHDMDWVPDPVDAGPGYKRSKNADIIGTLISVLGAQEVFIKQFQNIIGEHLLRNDGGFQKEMQVLELLKVRFGEPPLQACEVMLRDIQDSTGVNRLIISKQGKKTVDRIPPGGMIVPSLRIEDDDAEREEAEEITEINAKILSRLFWPSLNDEQFIVPHSIATLQETYEKGFESLKSARKLTWLPALGQATVSLELQDRTITEEVHTWQAAVIHAFNSPDSETSISKTIPDLESELEMDEDLISSALRFWTHKLVLHESSSGTYTVLETLSSHDRERSHAQTLLSASNQHSHAGGSEDSTLGGRKGGNNGKAGIGKDSDKMGIYWSFVQGMLTNSRKEMAVGQIGMMLKMLIVEGFPFSNEELGEWLGGKVQEGVLEVSGGKYRLRR